MEQAELEVFLREILIKHSRIRLVRVRDEDILTRDLGFDSFALLNMILDLEDRFRVEIDPSRLSNLREMDFRAFVALVGEQMCPAAPPSPGKPAIATSLPIPPGQS